MMGYKDMTWCTQTTCSKFGKGCHRSLTDEELENAYHWWNDGKSGEHSHPPIMVYAATPDCYEEKQ